MQYWLVKQEPGAYAWEQFVADRKTTWDGVRNYQARNHLRAMAVGDEALFYRSVEAPAVVGVAKVARAAFPDPTADEPGWVAVELAVAAALRREAPLAELKADPRLKGLLLLRQSRLSVMPVAKEHFAAIVEMGGGRVKV